MVIVDRALSKREQDGKPINVAIVGAGVTGKMIALQLLTPITGIRLAAIANRTPGKAMQAYANAGVDADIVSTLSDLEDRVAQGRPSVVEDASLVCRAGNIDVVIEVTGTVEFGAQVAVEAIAHRKHLILVNAELDSTVGPILKHRADRAGVVITNTDGDEPGVAMTLLRYVQSVGLPSQPATSKA